MTSNHNRRGRPAIRRQQVLDAIIEAGEVPSFARLARQVGLYDYREARRIVSDLRKLAAL